MSKHKIVAGGTVILATLVAQAVIAAPTGPGGNFGGHVGWAKAQDADDGNFLFGAHAELRLIPWLGIQGAADYRLADELTFPNGGKLDIRSVPLTVTARLYAIATEQFSLFAAAGAGWYHLMYDFSADLEDLGIDDYDKNTFGWHVGAGIVLPVTPTLALYGEGRAIFVDPEQEIDDALLDEVTDFDYDSTYFAAGVNFQF